LPRRHLIGAGRQTVGAVGIFPPQPHKNPTQKSHPHTKIPPRLPRQQNEGFREKTFVAHELAFQFVVRERAI
jgi:hypothetical protein